MYSLCCISNILKEQGISFKTMTLRTFNRLTEKNPELALTSLSEIWLHNVKVTQQTVKLCAQKGWNYRVSSSLFPILTHAGSQIDFSSMSHSPQILSIMSEIKTMNRPGRDGVPYVRLSTHPDQFNVLASSNTDAVDRTIVELNHHGWMMDMLGCDRSRYNPINIHVNCSYGSPATIHARFMENFNRLNDSVKSRLVLEVEDKGCWNAKNLLRYFYTESGFSITYDNLHDRCNPSIENAREQCAETWACKPLFHYSESDPDSANPRSHAEMPLGTPNDDRFDWEIEIKGKCYAIQKIESYDAMNELAATSQKLGLYK